MTDLNCPNAHKGVKCGQCATCKQAHSLISGAKRQADFRARQMLLKRKTRTLQLTDEEIYYLKRTLEHMRKHPTEKPAQMRCVISGRFSHLDT